MITKMSTKPDIQGLSIGSQFVKRSFDFLLSLVGLIIFGWLMIVCAILAAVDTGQNGFFTQTRVGKDGKLFRVIKIRTMRNDVKITTSVTTTKDPRITKFGRFFRRYKLDELPQLINVIKGEMSFVGPRPDVPGFADQLMGDDQIVLTIRPGITGPATLHFRHEEQLLSQQADPERYNREVIYPKKVALNRQYIENYSLRQDIGYIMQTILGG